MPWYFPWSDAIKKRACRYLLQRYLGQFLNEKLSLDQLSVDLYSGKGTITDLYLDVEALNELGETYNLPLEFVDGYINSISVSIPWSALLTENSVVVVTGLMMTIQPKQRSEDVLCRIKVQFVDTVIRLEHVPQESKSGVALEVHVKKIDYFDEAGVEESTSPDSFSQRNVYEPAAYSVKRFYLEGSSIFTDEFPSKSRTYARSMSTSNRSSPECKLSEGTTNIPSSPEMPPSHSELSNEKVSPETEPESNSDPILISRLSGRQQIKLTLRHHETTSGPKVEVEFHFGPVAALLTPRQVYILFELMKGLARPDTEDTSNVLPNNKSQSKPMAPADYVLVEQELQRQLKQPCFPTHALFPQKGWSTHSLDDSDEEFLPMTTGGIMGSSGVSDKGTIASEMESSQCSSTSSGTIKSSASAGTFSQKSTAPKRKTRPTKSRGSVQGLLEDPVCELTQFRGQCGSLCLIILHDDILTLSSSLVSGSMTPSPQTVSQMKMMADKFFTDLAAVTMAGHSFRDFQDMRDQLSQICQINHLRLMAAPVTLEGSEKSSLLQWLLSMSITVANLEVVECLFEKKSNLTDPNKDTMSVEYSELLSFSKEPLKSLGINLPGWTDPSFKMKFEQVEKAFQSHKVKNPHTSISIHMGPFHSEIDISIVDRINALLNPQPLCQVVEKQQEEPTSQVWKDDDHSLTPGERTFLHFTSPFVILKYRFPIPDLRPLHDMDRVPWWQHNLRKDLFIAELSEATLSTTISSTDPQVKWELQCFDAHGLFQENPTEPPISFLRVSAESGEGSIRDDGFDWPRLVIKVSPLQSVSVLETEVLSDKEEPYNSNSFDSFICQVDAAEPSPFASRQVVYETNHYDHGETKEKQRQDSGSETDQVIMPADKAQLADFIEKTLNNTQISLEFTLPTISLFFPSKHFYEVLYNRFSTDLLLWEPVASQSVCSSELNMGQPQFIATDLTTQLARDNDGGLQTFSMCKSALHYDSSSDSEEGTGMYYSVYEHRQRQKRKQLKEQNYKQRGQSYLCLSLNINKGLISFHSPLRDASHNVVPGQQGEFQLHSEDAMLFVVSRYLGDPDVGYLCVQSNKATLFHKGMLSTSPERGKLKPAQLVIPSHLYSTVYRSEPGVLMSQNSVIGVGGDSLDMMTLSIGINLDEAQAIKTLKVALGIQGATLRHRMTSTPESWLTQCIDFFDVVDYPVAGYVPPTIVTELHLHLWSCAIDYRPLYLPLRAMVTMENFSISSNIVAHTTTSVLRIIAEEMCLFISDKGETDAIDLKKNYTCVVESGLFDLSLRMTDGMDMPQPRLDLRASNNVVYIRTCADSCQALQSLLTYFASDGDLSDDVFSSRPSEVPVLFTKPSTESPNNVTKTQAEKVHDLMVEAMEESSGSICSSEESPTSTASNDGTRTKGKKLADSGTGIVVDVNLDHFQDETEVADEDDRCEEDETNGADEEFCILENDPGIGITPKSGEPQVRCLTTEPVKLVESHFSVPLGKSDQLRAPKHFPPAVWRYTLREMSIVWHMYGGKDFDTSISGKETAKKTSSQESIDRLSDKGKDQPDSPITSRNKGPTIHFHPQGMGVSFSKLSRTDSPTLETYSQASPRHSRHSGKSWLTDGGPGRRHDVHMELRMNKVRFQYEVYPENCEQASRHVLLIHDVEIRDRLASSQINKFLYQYTSEAMPKQSHANMVEIKAVHIHPDLNLQTEECSLRVSIKPLRLNIDQDALLFIQNFFSEIAGVSSKTGHYSNVSRHPLSTSDHQSPVMGMAPPASSGLTPTEPDHFLILLQETTEEAQDLIQDIYVQKNNSISASTPASVPSRPTFFRSFILTPDVPIRLDYHGKRVDMEQGALAGLLMGLGQLNCSELRLKRLCYRLGLLGVDKLLAYALSEWLTDIKKNQLPSLLGGVGPMHSIVQLFQGIRDLFWLPVEQYRRDGRIVRGLQRGASSFTTSTAMACLELTSRFVETIQSAAEFTYDMVSPGPSVKMHHRGFRRRGTHPADLREGMTSAFHVVREGIGDAARMIMKVASEEHEHKGVSGAVGGVLRQLPPTVVKPVILATQATSNVLGGMRNQLVPDARKEAEEKWRKREHVII
ncbi:autophagy-related 2 isoform X2 [Tachypleus tridentatus]|uniref:autophagy-related 2 isoform X2 n=1 Tax=Tachypleus tridentatus TaxID=6853 RepID=UPI003FD09927